jgi:hypothetical protein
VKRTIIIKDPEAGPKTEAHASAPPKGASTLRCLVSLGCALAADGLQWLVPPLWVLCDGAMVVALLLIWGRRWEIAVAVIPEVIPGLDLFPTWTLFVGYLIAMRRKEPPGSPMTNVTPQKKLPER